jgi:hypothetical protein
VVAHTTKAEEDLIMARHGVIVEHEQKLKKAQEAHERKLERNRRWYEANKEKVRLANGGNPAGAPAPKGAGRPLGTPNKRTVHARVVLDDLGANPAAFLAQTMTDETNPLDIRIDCAKSLMPYVFPKLSAVEVTGPDGDSVRVEHEHTLMMRMMGDPLLVHRMEDLVIEQAEAERRERGMLPAAYLPELPG